MKNKFFSLLLISLNAVSDKKTFKAAGFESLSTVGTLFIWQ